MKFIIDNREVADFNLTNNEMVELLNSQSTTDEEKEQLKNLIVSRFQYNLCGYAGETEDDVFARFFANFVNGRMHSKRKVAEKMANDHRYLQSEMLKVCLEYIRVLAEHNEKGYYDGRNEWACKTSGKIIELLKAENYYI
jgi:hypothetical protein